MKLSHSIATTLFVSVAALTSACSDEATDDGGTTGGTGGSATGGTATGGTAGSGTSGSAGSGTSGTGGSATGGAAGSGTSGSGGSAGSAVPDYPTDSSQAGIEAFLATNNYTMPGKGFRPESMPSDGASPPHLAVKRYFNETIIASTGAGNSRNMHTVGSMSIKDILEGTTVIGKAATLKTGDTSWAYYCVSSVAGRCFTNSPANQAYYSTSSGSCACHSMGINLSSMAIPAP